MPPPRPRQAFQLHRSIPCNDQDCANLKVMRQKAPATFTFSASCWQYIIGTSICRPRSCPGSCAGAPGHAEGVLVGALQGGAVRLCQAVGAVRQRQLQLGARPLYHGRCRSVDLVITVFMFMLCCCCKRRWQSMLWHLTYGRLPDFTRCRTLHLCQLSVRLLCS